MEAEMSMQALAFLNKNHSTRSEINLGYLENIELGKYSNQESSPFAR